MKLFVIGDSFSQGFMSLAAARTDLSYPSLIAKSMQINNWQIPNWPKGGLPINVELLLREIQNLCGPELELLEWPKALLKMGSIFDAVEDYYERGQGAPNVPDPSGFDYFHNVAIRGFDVADAWLVDSELCYQKIDDETRWFFNDGVYALPSASLYRTALNVLNPSRDPNLNKMTALDWLKHHHTGGRDPQGVENLILWLGSNNALGTIIDLKINATNDPTRNYDRSLSHSQRLDFNLWSPEHFEEDFSELMSRVNEIMTNNGSDWQVFVGNVPAVTIAPLAKGVGKCVRRTDPFEVVPHARYFKYYTYFMFEKDYAQTSERKLTREQAYSIDEYIASYNESIRNWLDILNGKYRKNRYHYVDLNRAFVQAAYKRNGEEPCYQFPPELKKRNPMVDTRFYHATSEGRVTQGGIFSLDGVHPSAIGQGLIAHEFLKVINDVRKTNYAVDWDTVYESDDLYMRPLRIMPWLRKQDELASLFLEVNSIFGR